MRAGSKFKYGERVDGDEGTATNKYVLSVTDNQEKIRYHNVSSMHKN